MCLPCLLNKTHFNTRAPYTPTTVASISQYGKSMANSWTSKTFTLTFIQNFWHAFLEFIWHENMYSYKHISRFSLQIWQTTVNVTPAWCLKICVFCNAALSFLLNFSFTHTTCHSRDWIFDTCPSLLCINAAIISLKSVNSLLAQRQMSPGRQQRCTHCIASCQGN